MGGHGALERDGQCTARLDRREQEQQEEPDGKQIEGLCGLGQTSDLAPGFTQRRVHWHYKISPHCQWQPATGQ